MILQIFNFLSPLLAEIVPTINLPTVAGLTGTQQFILALIAIVGNSIFAFLSWRKSEQTHLLVNSRMTEFKESLVKEMAGTIEDFKKTILKSAAFDKGLVKAVEPVLVQPTQFVAPVPLVPHTESSPIEVKVINSTTESVPVVQT